MLKGKKFVSKTVFGTKNNRGKDVLKIFTVKKEMFVK